MNFYVNCPPLPSDRISTHFRHFADKKVVRELSADCPLRWTFYVQF
nr:MAG TPA: hypothetical protein [Caudoviricetes sp.]